MQNINITLTAGYVWMACSFITYYAMRLFMRYSTATTTGYDIPIVCITHLLLAVFVWASYKLRLNDKRSGGVMFLLIGICVVIQLLFGLAFWAHLSIHVLW